MGLDPADIIKFVLFGIIWLFPFAVLIAVLSFSAADAKARKEDPGPNVVPFPNRPMPAPAKKPSFVNRFKRLAFPARGG